MQCYKFPIEIMEIVTLQYESQKKMILLSGYLNLSMKCSEDIEVFTQITVVDHHLKEAYITVDGRIVNAFHENLSSGCKISFNITA